MKLKLLTGLAGDNFSYVRGDEIPWSDEMDAARLIRAGHAQPADAESKKRYEELEGQLDVPRPKKGPHKPIPEPTLKNQPPELPNSSTVPVTELDLDDNTIAALQAAGLETIGDVTAHPDLTKLDGIGKATAAKILKACASV